MKLPVYVPVVDLCRGNFTDQRFFGLAKLFDKNGAKALIGEDNSYPFLLRSLLKPIQASITADYDTASFYDFTDEELAVMQASHAGEAVHTGLIKSILNKIGLCEDNLLCPVIEPLNPNVLAPGETPFKIHNNCSGKHSMFLAVSKQLGFPLEDYNSVNHPVQKIALQKIVELSAFKNPPQSFDGCTLPVWALPLDNIAQAFYHLYADEKYSFLKNAYIKNPYIIGGTGKDGKRQDTLFMELNPKLISKTGAGGFLSVYNDETKEFLLIKMAQDNNHARLLFASKLLVGLGWIKNSPVDFNFYDEKGRAVGEYFVKGF